MIIIVLEVNILFSIVAFTFSFGIRARLNTFVLFWICCVLYLFGFLFMFPFEFVVKPNVVGETDEKGIIVNYCNVCSFF